MKGWLKVLLGVVGALILAIVLAIVGLLLFFDPNDYKSQIDAAIQRQIGRSVRIDGDIKLSVFPWLGFDLGRITVANARGFGGEPMATVKSAGLSIELLPLFERQIHIGKVSLNGLRLRLARDAQGRTNWADIVRHLADEQNGVAPSPEPTRGAGNGHGFHLNSLQIGAIDIGDAAVSWSDAVTGADYRLTGVRAETGRLTDGKPFRLEVGGKLVAPEQRLQAEFNVVASIEPNLVDKFYRFSNLSANVLVSGKTVPGGRQEANLSASGDLDMAAGRFKLANLTVQGAGVNISGDVDGTGLNGRLAYNGRIMVQNFNPRSVMQQLKLKPLAIQDSSALTSAGFDAQFNGDAEGVAFKQISATLDASTLRGTARVHDFEHPEFSFNLKLDRLNVDNYLSPENSGSAQAAEAAKSGGRANGKNDEIDITPVKWLNLNGQMAIGSLVAAGIHVANARVALKAHDGVLTIDPLTADLYGGTLHMTGRVDARAKQPRYALKGTLAGLKFAPLLKDVAGTDRLSADANLVVDLTSSGLQVAAMKRALNGRIGFDLQNGAFNGFNLARIVAAARSRLDGGKKKTSGSGVGAGDKTPFNRLAGHFDIERGILSGKDMTLGARHLDATGRGQYDLARDALNYTISAKVPEDASGALSGLAGLTVPIRLTGSLWSPDYTLDLASVARDAARQRLDREKAKLKKKLQDKLNDKGSGDIGNQIQQGISHFLGGGKTEGGNSGK